MAIEDDELTRQRGAYTNLGTARTDAGFAPPTGGTAAAQTEFNIAQPAPPAGVQSTQPMTFATPGFDDRNAELAKILADARARTPQTITAANATGATLGPAAQTTAAGVAPVSNAGSVTLGPAARAGGVSIGGASAAAPQLGPAATATAATIDPVTRAAAAALGPAQLAQDSAFRGDQAQLALMLQRLSRGEGSVAAVEAQRQQEALMRAQMSMAASARPGQAAAAQRLAAQQGGTLGQEMASRTLEAQLAERQAAQMALGQVLGTARGQDLGLSTFNAGQQNTNQLAQAGFQQQANMADASAGNVRALQQAGMQTDVGKFNAGALNQQEQAGAQMATQASIASAANKTQASIAQGQTAAQVGMFNAGQANDLNRFGAGLQQQTNLFNSDAANRASMQAAGFQQDANLANTGWTNQQNLALAQMLQQNNQFNAGMEQGTNQFNVNTGLNQQQITDSASFNALGQMLQNAALQQQGTIAGAQMSQQLDLAHMDDATRRWMVEQQVKAQADEQPGFWDKMLGGAISLGTAAMPALVAASDARLKTNVRPIRVVAA